MIAQDIMTENPVTIRATNTVADTCEVLQDMEIRHLPVVQGTELVGIISDRDLRSVHMPRLVDEETLQNVKERYHAPISSLMSPDVVRVFPDSNVEEIIELMLEHKVGAVPVVDAGTGDLLGIVSYVDILRSMHSMLAET
ncbi:MAG: CBS domain-containing protein [Proteobacteria bacterium]|nr:CBS domain-containing protein [Pseudomonadota bacterium]